MTRSELIQKVADWTFEITPVQAEMIVSGMLDEIVCALEKGQRVELRNFGTFYPRHRPAHKGRNPKTGEPVTVPDRKVMRFKAGKDLKEHLNGKKPEVRWTDER
ncbi:integration host factor subunit beta [Caedimonas varicaedens]|jgi:integration host factor subunit beta|uniref:Integration host factor subunit beta n=1 Tax=Caedimonas varicaedens TaxID=1629334 RepID=A0A0K8MAW5_9PROT|nr:integration host factor subunit beta [Caedimonas varicaedens]